MLLSILAGLLLLAVGVLIWVDSYADHIRDTNKALVAEKERLEARIKTMEEAHHWHLENIAKIYLAEVQRRHGMKTQPSGPPRGADGRFVKAAAK